MKLTDKINKTLATGLIGISLLATSCIAPITESKTTKQVHKDCYGLHIKNNSNGLEVQTYKDGWKVHQDNLTEDTIKIQITKDKLTYTYKDFSEKYSLEMKKDGTIYATQ